LCIFNILQRLATRTLQVIIASLENIIHAEEK